MIEVGVHSRKLVTYFSFSMCSLFLEPHPPIDDVIRCEVIPRFIYFLQRDDNSMLQVQPYLSNPSLFWYCLFSVKIR